MDERLRPSASEADLYRLAFDLSPTGILVVEPDGRILLCNREIERLFGYGRDELRGASVELLIPARLRGAHPAFREHYLEDASPRRMGSGRDLHGQRKDGREVPLEIGLNPIEMDGRTVVLATVVDISARRSVEDSLRQAQKMEAIGTLAGGIAHDFNNILLGIVGHAELIGGSGGLGAQQQRDLERVLSHAERGRQLVERILTFSRQNAVEQVPLDPCHAVHELLELLHATLPMGIALREKLDADTPRVLADPTQLQQIVMNLVTNAAHAMPDGGVIEVHVEPYVVEPGATAGDGQRAPGLYARLSVRDDGVGMDAEVAKRVFDPFFTTKEPDRGTGLGLAIIHGIAASHGATVDLDSAPGRGTRVDVDFPAYRERASSSDVPEAQGAPHVLLVEDEPLLAEMQARTLESLGYRVTPHTSSLEALESFRDAPERFDLLMTDQSMPKLDGMALIARVRELRPELPVLLVTGLAQSIAAELARTDVTLLEKPHRMAELQAALERAKGHAKGHGRGGAGGSPRD